MDLVGPTKGWCPNRGLLHNPQKTSKKVFLKVEINICHVFFFGGRGIGPNLTFHTPPFFGISSFVVVGGISRGWTGEKKQEITLLVQAN